MKRETLAVFLKNQELNAAKREHDKHRTLLLGLMEEAGVDALTCTGRDTDGQPVKLTATVATPTVSHVSIELLRQHVDEATFLKIVTATKSAVTHYAGELVTLQCEVKEPGKRDVFVKGLRLPE